MNPLTFFIIPLTYKIVNRFFVFLKLLPLTLQIQQPGIALYLLKMVPLLLLVVH